MEVIGKNRHREQVNSKVCSLSFQLRFNPDLMAVEVLSRKGDRIQKESSDVSPYR